MKQTLTLLTLLFSLSAFSQNASRDGGVTSGGVPGFQYLQCHGELIVNKTKKVNGSLSVQTEPLKGILVRAFDNKGNVVVKDEVVRETNMMGKIWRSKSVTITIPNIQSHDLGAGEVRAIVKFEKAEMASIITCQQWEIH